MSQLFRRSSNSKARAFIAILILLVSGSGWALYRAQWSSYMSGAELPREQIVPFSHKHHVQGLGLDCRMCHTSVEQSAFAGLPPTETCMTCHSQLWTDAPLLAPVRQSLARGEGLRWNRVYDLPDFVFFNHGIHVRQGIGCTTCHGPVDQMPLVWQAQPLYMRWCLECHREPERFIRPRSEVFNVAWHPPPDQLDQGKQLVQQYQVHVTQLTDCSICHR
jgi:hypothetical protein